MQGSAFQHSIPTEQQTHVEPPCRAAHFNIQYLQNNKLMLNPHAGQRISTLNTYRTTNSCWTPMQGSALVCLSFPSDSIPSIIWVTGADNLAPLLAWTEPILPQHLSPVTNRFSHVLLTATLHHSFPGCVGELIRCTPHPLAWWRPLIWFTVDGNTCLSIRWCSYGFFWVHLYHSHWKRAHPCSV